MELVLNLETHIHSVVCTAHTEVFHINMKSIERLITRKNQTTLTLLRDHVEQRMCARAHSQLGSDILLYSRILDHLEFTRPKRFRNATSDDKVLQAVTLEEKSRQKTLKQLVKLYLKDRSPLIDPFVPGAVYYKTKAVEKEGKAVDKLETMVPEVGVANVRLERARKAAHRQPRSRRELERLTVAQDPEEITKLQKSFAIPDIELRTKLKKDNKDFVLPHYRAFLKKYAHLHFTKNPEKYIKYTEKDVSDFIDQFFDASS